jgi:uncharacterized protein (DUF2237 family)
MSSQLNIFGKPVTPCSYSPLTGWNRGGYCYTDSSDIGTHVVCAKVTNEFLTFTKSRGNDLSTPSKYFNFPGLKDGDFWCLCALRWKEAYDYDPSIAPKINLNATHVKALQYIPYDILVKYGL